MSAKKKKKGAAKKGSKRTKKARGAAKRAYKSRKKAKRRGAKRRSTVAGGVQTHNLFATLKKQGKKLRVGTTCNTKKVPKALLPKGARVVRDGKTPSGTQLWQVRGKKRGGAAKSGGGAKGFKGHRLPKDLTPNEKAALAFGGTAGRVTDGKYTSPHMVAAAAKAAQVAKEREILKEKYGVTHARALTPEQLYEAKNELGLDISALR